MGSPEMSSDLGHPRLGEDAPVRRRSADPPGDPAVRIGGLTRHLSEGRDDRSRDSVGSPAISPRSGGGRGTGEGAGEGRGEQEGAPGRTQGREGQPPSRLRLRSVSPDLPLAERVGEVREAAFEAFARTGNWVVFYRELLGVDGICRKAFPDPDEWERFVASDVYRDLQEMLAALRGQDLDKAAAAEPEKMITIRIPVSLHAALHSEAKAANLSLNKLCISKLLQSIDSRFVPDHRGGIPGPKMIEKVVTGQ